ncbi:amino acid transporter [Mytilinidion resinicola]|uniref:Amino acid transporter n=1 Tax=Mytilinidion resinicola TaxID=574789 RepID=A0A6A6Z7G0_9PEZI|nr:amino acid transporter [Mytilinidion resinicola]KAF2816758.1 amino acid transporter [Mytilinidion resinicola]
MVLDDKNIELSVHEGASGMTDEIPRGTGNSGSVGQNRELDRYITLKPAVAFGLTVLSTWEGIGITFGAGLLNGGPTSLVYGLVMATIGSLSIALSLGEMASITPVVGAQYRWSGLYAPHGIMTPAFWSLIQGWLTTFAWIALCAGGSYVNASMTQGLIGLNNPTYIPKLWHVTLLMWAFISVTVVLNLYARKVLVVIEMFGGIVHFAFFIATVVTLAVMGSPSSAEYVFTSSSYGLSGWENQGVQWCIGLLTSTSLLTGFDGVLHLSNEMKDAPKKVPTSMALGVIINGILAFGFILTLLFFIGDPMEALLSPTGYPVIQIYLNATGSLAGATTLTCFIIIPSVICNFSVYASVTRLVWAFARDKGLPFSSYFAYVHPTLRMPTRALGLVATICALIGLITVGNTSAFYAVISLGAIALYISYIVPIFLFLLRKIQGEHPHYGPFSLGKFGLAINIYAVIWCLFCIVWLPFPSVVPVTAANFNYAGPIMLFVIFLALCDWFTSGHKRFTIPTDPDKVQD